MNVVGQISEARVEALRRFVRGHQITEQVVRALDAAGWALDEIHEMDEFTFDLVVALPDGLCLVYDTT